METSMRKGRKWETCLRGVLAIVKGRLLLKDLYHHQRSQSFRLASKLKIVEDDGNNTLCPPSRCITKRRFIVGSSIYLVSFSVAL